MAILTRDELEISLRLRQDDATDSGNEYSDIENGIIILPRKIHGEYWDNYEKIISLWYSWDNSYLLDKESLLQYLIAGVNKMGENNEGALSVIVDEFRAFKEIKSIYMQRFREEVQLFILLAIDRYNAQLMDSLLDREYHVRTKYPEILFEFFYPPSGISEKEDLIHPEARCLYKRSNHGN